MIETIKQILYLATKSKKIWLAPIILGLVFIAFLIITVSLSPTPIFLYPLL